MSAPLTAANPRAREVHVSVQKNSQTISLSCHSVADSGLINLLPIVLSFIITYKLLYVKSLFILFTYL